MISPVADVQIEEIIPVDEKAEKVISLVVRPGNGGRVSITSDIKSTLRVLLRDILDGILK